MRQAFPVWWTFSMGKPIQFVCRSELWINQPAFPSPSLFFFLSSFPILIPCSQYFFWIPPVFPEIVLGRKILFVSCDDEKKKKISYHFIPFVSVISLPLHFKQCFFIPLLFLYCSVLPKFVNFVSFFPPPKNNFLTYSKIGSLFLFN